MLKSKGFTLIELLAVIVILAVVALITSPIILNIIDSAKAKTRAQSANGVLNAARLFYSESLLDQMIIYPAEGLEFVCDGTICQAMIGNTMSEEGISLLTSEEPSIYKLNISGTIPSSGSILIRSDGSIFPTSMAIDSNICLYDEQKKMFIEC